MDAPQGGHSFLLNVGIIAAAGKALARITVSAADKTDTILYLKSRP